MSNVQSPMAVLQEEHDAVQQKLDALEEAISHLDRKEAIASKLEELTSFFKTDFWVHFTKEEDALFPEMEKFIPRDSGPIGVMLMEHEDLRNTNAEFQRLVAVYFAEPDNLEVRKLIDKHGNHFIGVLRAHIDKENGILFRIADMHLDQNQREKILAQFEGIEAAQGAKAV